MSKVFWLGRCDCEVCDATSVERGWNPYFVNQTKKGLLNTRCGTGFEGEYCHSEFERLTGIKLEPGEIRKVRLELVD